MGRKISFFRFQPVRQVHADPVQLRRGSHRGPDQQLPDRKGGQQIDKINYAILEEKLF